MPAADDVDTMLPYPWSRISFHAGWVTLKAPRRWTSRTGSTRSDPMLWNDLSRRMPALLITMSTLPKVSTAVCTIAAPPSGVATESVLATASPPASWISSTTSWAAPLSLPVPSTEPPRSFTTMSAPRLAIISACCLPRPPPAPVMIATLPSNPRSVMAQTLTAQPVAPETTTPPGTVAPPPVLRPPAPPLRSRRRRGPVTGEAVGEVADDAVGQQHCGHHEHRPVDGELVLARRVAQQLGEHAAAGECPGHDGTDGGADPGQVRHGEHADRPGEWVERPRRQRPQLVGGEPSGQAGETGRDGERRQLHARRVDPGGRRSAFVGANGQPTLGLAGATQPGHEHHAQARHDDHEQAVRPTRERVSDGVDAQVDPADRGGLD